MGRSERYLALIRRLVVQSGSSDTGNQSPLILPTIASINHLNRPLIYPSNPQPNQAH